MASKVVLLELELLQLATTALMLLLSHRLAPETLRRCWRTIRSLSEHRRTCIALVGLLGFGASAGLTSALGTPAPRVHDEFGYLLAADTFAQGRLSNPAHPNWVHFEAVHVNHQPTYHSMYPPGQGLALAAGQALSGHPIVGVWMSMGLACAAICWMLQAWVPPQWALIGGVLAAFRFVFMRHPGTWVLQIGYWSQSYWGGAVALFGGALVFGALRRIVRCPRKRDAALLGFGLAVLANSRPFEGFMAGLPVAAVTLTCIWHHCRRGQRHVWRIVAPLGIVLTLAFMWMGYYHLRTTGNALLRPYDLNGRTYAITPTTLLQTIGPEPEYRHEHLRRYHEWARTEVLRQQSPQGYLKRLRHKATLLWAFYFGVLLSIPLIALPWALRSAWAQFAAATCGFVLLALAFMPWFHVHYLAPIAPLFVFLEVHCLRVLWLSRGLAGPIWRSLSAAIALAVILAMPLAAALWSKGEQPDHWHIQRQQILQQLIAAGGKHLLLVSGHQDAHDAWVYNGADLDNAPVVWAHDMGAAQNAPLLKHFRDRRVWQLKIADDPRKVEPVAHASASRETDGEQ